MSILVLTLFLQTPNFDTIKPKAFEYPYKVEVFDLPQAANGVKYRLFVRPPLRKPAPESQASSFYFFDALRNFTPAAAMSYNYEFFNYIPAAYFIGIGYTNEADGITKESNRTRDYTPTSFKPPNDQHFLANSPQDWKGSGGAAAFFEVIQDLIIPFIESKYNVGKTDRVLIGKSTSGLGALYGALAKPELFNRYLVVSPAIWWDDWLKPRHQRAVMELAASTKTQKMGRETRIYLAVGQAEERLRLVTDMYVLADTLRQRQDKNLKIALEVLPGEQHESVFPSAFMRGIVALYADEPNRRSSASPVTWD